MEEMLADMTTSITEFKKNPNEAVRKAHKRPFAVLTNNRPSFYVITPELFEKISEMLFEIETAPVIRKRMRDLHKAIPVGLNEL
ncbi:antitoxin YafN [mine drainage metagenome]|uniref:Antitoxin YafN n=1 Tax=mine drainage metagenome TaxID=410659 RepID=A0A1J5QJW0_9ZZZZ